MGKADKRRQQVYDLVLTKHQKVADVAELMRVPERTIRADVAELNRQMAADMMQMGQEQRRVNLIDETRQQKGRIYRYLQGDITDSARAKYEAILLDIGRQSEKFFDKLASLAQKGGGSDLEDHLKSMAFSKFNEFIGLPPHPNSKLPGPITQAQLGVFEAVDPQRRSWLIVNKSRQIGITEIVLRILVYLSFSKYRGKKIAIVAGTRVETAMEIFERLKALFRNIPEAVQLAAADHLILKNGTSYHVVPASKNAINGWTGFAAFLLDESAFWNLEEDTVILNSFLPIARTNGSDVFQISNPNGMRGFFWHIWEAPSPSWTKLEIDIHRGGRELYTPEQIQEMIDSSDEDPASAYLCKFVGGRDSVLGDLSQEDMTSIYEAVAFD